MTCCRPSQQPAIRSFTRRFIHRLNPGTKLHRQWTSPLYYVFILLYGKVIITTSKGYFSIVVPQVDGGVFPTFLAERQRIKKRQIVQTNKTASRWKKMLMFQNALVKITRSLHSLSTTYLLLLPSGTSGWFFSSLVNVQSFPQLSETVLPTETARLFTSDDLGSWFTFACVKARESIWWEMWRILSQKRFLHKFYWGKSLNF